MFSVLSTDVHIYNRRFPDFPKHPKVVGFMSLDRDGQFCLNTKQLKFINKVANRSVHFDLNKGLSKEIRRTEEQEEKWFNLLKFLMEQGKRLNCFVANNIHEVRFYCYRGLLARIACTPYENREPWRIAAALYRGGIYLCCRDTPESVKQKKYMTDKDKQFTSWGYKFEQYLLSDMPNSEPNTDVPVIEAEEFSLILATNLNRHQLVYVTETDGLLCDEETQPPPDIELGVDPTLEYLSNKEFVEVKTSRHIEFPNQENNFKRFKTRKWWCQSFFGGVETVVCGFRNDLGVVEELRVFTTKELSEMSSKFWNPNVCMNFVNYFLSHVKSCFVKKIRMRHNDEVLDNLSSLPLLHMQFVWHPGMPVRVTENYNYDEDPILPQWYIDGIKKQK